MSNIFSYDSKPMQILMFVGDLIILNLLYLVCCIPVFTIGAAQAGLFTGCRVLMDKEDDTSPSAAFFRGFTAGFGTVTLAWVMVTLLLLVVVYASITGIILGAPVWLMIPGIVVCVIFQTLVPVFHSRFGCTVWQLIRNAFLLMLSHPLRAFATAAMLWVPVICFLVLDIYTSMSISLLWLTMYYATAVSIGTAFMKKPLQSLVDMFHERQQEQPEQLEEPEEITQ